MGKNTCEKGGDDMEKEMTRRELLDSLVDIRDVKIDRSMSVEERTNSYVEQIKNLYMFKVGNTVGMDVAFKNLIYDYYSKDLSKKVKSAMGLKQKKAQYVNTVPYGYKADPADKHHLIIDVETAPIVRRIFMDVISGKSCTQIAKELNTEGIPTSAQYKAVSRKASSKKPQWTHHSLLTMIESVKYTGTMVNHTHESRFIRDRNQRRVPKEEWYIRENAHEPIVTNDEYEPAQEAIQRRRKFARSTHDQLDRVYFCAHCGGKLEKANGTVFACPSHRYHDGSPCENVRWRKSALEEIVFEALKRQIEIIRVESAAIKKTAKSKGESRKTAHLAESPV